MAEDLNNVILVGRLTRDIELSQTPNGFAIGRLALAVNRRRKNKEQEWEDEVNFFDLILWGKRAEALQRYLLKGTQVAVQGQLKQDRWEQDGQRRSRVVVELSQIQLLGGRSGASSDYRNPNQTAGIPTSNSYSNNISSHSAGGTGGNPVPPQSPNGPIMADNDFEDDIPF